LSISEDSNVLSSDQIFSDNTCVLLCNANKINDPIIDKSDILLITLFFYKINALSKKLERAFIDLAL
jgi:hypothetical protein